MKAINGQIWRAKEAVIVTPKHAGKETGLRRIVVEKGELCEFRYWSPAVLRIRGEIYVAVEEDEFYEKFEFIGTIFEQVYHRNNNTTAQILDARLYENAERVSE